VFHIVTVCRLKRLKDIVIELDSLTLVRLRAINNATLAVRLRRSTGAVLMKFRNLIESVTRNRADCTHNIIA
jgi:hypothetical protein